MGRSLATGRASPARADLDYGVYILVGLGRLLGPVGRSLDEIRQGAQIQRRVLHDIPKLPWLGR